MDMARVSSKMRELAERDAGERRKGGSEVRNRVSDQENDEGSSSKSIPLQYRSGFTLFAV
jgi:hypothetical protein